VAGSRVTGQNRQNVGLHCARGLAPSSRTMTRTIFILCALCILRGGSAFYLPGLAPVNFCMEPTKTCKVRHGPNTVPTPTQHRPNTVPTPTQHRPTIASTRSIGHRSCPHFPISRPPHINAPTHVRADIIIASPANKYPPLVPSKHFAKHRPLLSF
jgi:hypothetical protein